MPISNYPNGFAHGVTIRGIPLTAAHPGKVFWVNNSSVLAEGGIGGSNGNPGTYQKPFSTIDYAIGRCTAGRGDIIMVMPGHVETITAADAILLDVAGVCVIGLGVGSLMPRIDFNNTAATVGVSADNVSIVGIHFRALISAVVVGVNVKADADGVTIENCLFSAETAGTDEFNHSIRFVDGNSRCAVKNCVIDMGIAGAVAGIHLDADTAFMRIEDNVIRGDYSTANIVGDTTLSTNILIKNNLLENGIGGDLGTEPGIELLTGTTGTIADNYIVCNLATKAASIVADTCLLFNNYYNEDISGAATGGIIGTASADD
jgi:hypothetical protein